MSTISCARRDVHGVHSWRDGFLKLRKNWCYGIIGVSGDFRYSAANFRDNLINLDDLGEIDPIYEIVQHRHILQFVGSSTSTMTYTCRNCSYVATYYKGALYSMIMGGQLYNDMMRVKDPEWR